MPRLAVRLIMVLEQTGQRGNADDVAVCAVGEIPKSLAELRESPATAKAKAKFVLATDGIDLEAEDLTTGETIA